MKSGAYRIERPLSKGGMGAIYLAIQPLAGVERKCVIKEMLDYFDANDPTEATKARQRFQAEAATLTVLAHPGIPKIYDYFSEQGRNYIVMEYVEGQDLLEGLTHEDRQGNVVPGSAYPVEDVIRWAIQVCHILEYLAGLPQAVIHHDIKPANLVLDRSLGEVRLVDFGTARSRLTSQTGSQSGMQKPSIYGTIGYAPKEQYSGKSTPRSDVYALGATMYHLLTDDDPQQHPFDFPDLTRLDDALAAILAQALENEESQRLDAAQLHQELEQWLQSPHKKATRSGSGDFRVVLPAIPDAAVKTTSRALVQLLQVPEEQATIWAYAAPRVVFKTRSRSDATRVTGQLKTAGIAARVIEVDESHSAALSATQKQQLASRGYVAGLTMTRLGADKRCKCYLCGHEWTSRKGTGELPPATCPQCKSSDWSQHRLFKCGICGQEFTHSDQSQSPTALFPACPACGAADWLPGQAPVLQLKAQKLNLGTVRVGEAKATGLNIANAGKGRLRGVVRCLEPWLRVEQPFSDGGKITLPLDTGQLIGGQQYRATLDIISSGGAAGVEVELVAQAPERMMVTPATLDFGHVGIHPPPAKTLQMANLGGGSLDGTATADQPWIQLSTSRISGNRPSLSVSVKPDEMSGAGLVSGTIRLKTNGGDVRVPVRVMPLPMTLTCIPPAVNLRAVPPRGTRRQGVRLVNNGTGTLQGRVASAPDWLRVEPTEWQGNSVELAVEVEGRRLAEGQKYTDVIRLSSNGGDVNLPVQAAIQGPTLGISPTALSFGPLPIGWREKRRVQLTNLGLGSLQGTAYTATPWLQVRPARFSGKTARLEVSTRTQGLAPGPHHGTVQIDSNGGRARIGVQAQLTSDSSLPLALKRYGLWFAAALALLAFLAGLAWGADQLGLFGPLLSTPTPTAVVTKVTVTPTRPSQTPATTGPTSTPAHGKTPTGGTKTSTPVPRQTTVTPTKHPTLAPTSTPVSACPNPGVRITWPESGAVVRGAIQIQGTANISGFSYYKFEFRPEGIPTWSYLTRSYRAVTNGTLMTWYTTTVPSGTYRLRLVVVDQTGNYPDPCEIRVTIQN